MKKYLLIIVVILIGCSGGGGAGGPKQATVVDKFNFIFSVEESTVFTKEFTDAISSATIGLESKLNGYLALPTRDIGVVFSDCGVVNAFYNPTTSQVIMCWELLEYVITEFVAIDEADGLGKAVNVFFGFVLLHEVGHALIDQYEIPVLGKEEDMADSIAVVLLTQDSTAEELLDAAWAFIDSGLVFVAAGVNWADTHTTGPQRFNDLTCQAVGAVPAVRLDPALVVVQSTIDALDAANRNCPAEFNETTESVLFVLEDYIIGTLQ